MQLLFAATLLMTVAGPLGESAGAQESPAPPTSLELVDQGRRLLPPYTGKHQDFLSADQRRGVEAAAHLMAAALALEPESTYALYWDCHSRKLLGEDSRSRGNFEQAQLEFQAALRSIDRALALEPESYWAWYSRGLALLRLGRPFEAIGDLDRCVQVAAAAADGAPDQASRQDPEYVRFKAREWGAEARIRVLLFEEAREEYRAFHADYGANAWNLAFDLTQTYLRGRDFESARETLEELLGVNDYSNFDRAYADLGYLAGLRGDREDATKRLEEALGRERAPSLYPRLWLVILGTDGALPRAKKGLQGFVDHPPREVPGWDLELGRFGLGLRSADEFLASAERELERRRANGTNLDDLMCEVHYYVGWHHEQAGRYQQAQASYWSALEFVPERFKWEWAFARVGYARVAAQRGLGSHLPAAAAGAGVRTLVHRIGGEPQTEIDRTEPTPPGLLVQRVFRLADGTLVLERGVAKAVGIR